MFVGHEFAAFALAVAGARWAGKNEDTALVVGLLAGASAFLPDLDLLVGTLAYASVVTGGTTASWEGLWSVSNAVHRGLSHTFLGALGGAILLTSTAIGRRSWSEGDRWSASGAATVGGTVVVGLLAVAIAAGGATEAFSIALVASGAVVLGAVSVAETELTRGEILAGSAAGFLAHPLGDVFLAAPPQFLYPLDHVLLTETVEFAADPTLNLLAIALVEVCTVWAGVLAYASVSRRSVRRALDPRALVGLAYPLPMAFVPTPTMVDAHWLGVTLVPTGAIGLLARPPAGATTRERAFHVLVTGLATISLASLAYGLVLLIPFGY
ncbi:MAG: metal-dependent hydrolase [Halanaeroarchaeum sp.]